MFRNISASLLVLDIQFIVLKLWNHSQLKAASTNAIDGPQLRFLQMKKVNQKFLKMTPLGLKNRYFRTKKCDVDERSLLFLGTGVAKCPSVRYDVLHLAISTYNLVVVPSFVKRRQVICTPLCLWWDPRDNPLFLKVLPIFWKMYIFNNFFKTNPLFQSYQLIFLTILKQ